MLPGTSDHGLNLVPRKVTRIKMRPYDRCKQTLLILKLSAHRLFLRPRIAALLHGRKDARLLPLRNTTEPDSCNKKEDISFKLQLKCIQLLNLKVIKYALTNIKSEWATMYKLTPYPNESIESKYLYNNRTTNNFIEMTRILHVWNIIGFFPPLKPQENCEALKRS